MTTSAAWPAGASSAAIPAAGRANPAPAPTTAPAPTSRAARSARSSPKSAGFADAGAEHPADLRGCAARQHLLAVDRAAGGRGASSAAIPAAGRSSRASPPANRPYFRPNNNVTRGQLSKIAAGAAGWTETPTGQTFEDVPPGSPFYLWVERIASRGIVGGYPCGGAGEPCLAPGQPPLLPPEQHRDPRPDGEDRPPPPSSPAARLRRGANPDRQAGQLPRRPQAEPDLIGRPAACVASPLRG